jgi:type II secretory pathway pseudopilin PulG
MEGLVVLLVLLIIGVPLALAVWLVVRAVQASNRIEEMSLRLGRLERELGARNGSTSGSKNF